MKSDSFVVEHCVPCSRDIKLEILLHKGFIVTSETAHTFTKNKIKYLEFFDRYTNCLPQFSLLLMKWGRKCVASLRNIKVRVKCQASYEIFLKIILLS